MEADQALCPLAVPPDDQVVEVVQVFTSTVEIRLGIVAVIAGVCHRIPGVAASTVAAAASGSKLLGRSAASVEAVVLVRCHERAGVAAHLLDGREERVLSGMSPVGIEAVLLSKRTAARERC